MEGILNKLKAYLPANYIEIISSYAFSIAMAILIFLVGKYIARKITNLLVNILRRIKGMDETLVRFLENIVYYILMIIVILSALSKLGVQTTSFLAILGAAGLAIGLALKDSLGNFASGVMIILFKPFKVGDYVQAANTAGTVTEVGIFSSIFTTPDNQKIIIPNSAIINGSITNVNANPTRRIDLVIGIGYDDDIKKVKNILESIVSVNDKILHTKGVTIAVSELADSSVNLVLRVWVKTADYWSVRFDLTETIKITFDTEGISIPYPQQDVHHYNN